MSPLTSQASKLDLWKKLSRPRQQPATPKWQFSTRKVDHDEKFLLSLMREKEPYTAQILGHFFYQVTTIGKPDEGKKILAVHSRGVPLDEDTDLICDIRSLLVLILRKFVNEAALLTAKRGGISFSKGRRNGSNRKKVGKRKIGSKEVGKLFRWMSWFLGKNDRTEWLARGSQTLS